jgi:preprotein translocase subunit SecB
MNETTGDAATAEGATDDSRPKFSVHAQYTKDLSFENPRAPGILFQSKDQPQGEIRVEIGNRSFGDDRYEVSLQITVEAKAEDSVAFMVELEYAGVFTIAGLTDEQREMVMAVECPRILYPFARRVVADTVRDGGLPALMLGPIDFLSLFRQRRGTASAKQSGNGKDQSAAASEVLDGMPDSGPQMADGIDDPGESDDGGGEAEAPKAKKKRAAKSTSKK